MGEILSIWLKRGHGGAMEFVDSAELIAGRGLRGNADQGRWRQVTVIDAAAWREAEADVRTDVDPSARRANILLRGINLQDSRGKTRPCQLMEDTQPGLREALKLKWRGGAFGQIVSGGTIRVGDPANLECGGSPPL